MNRPSILYCAPGSGLGHVNRALAVCLELQELGVSAQIVTNSPFAAGLAQLARFPITRIPAERWQADVRHFAAAVQPELMVCDTFPRGMRGEWKDGLPVPAIYMARRLNPEAVSTFLGDPGWPDGIVQVIAAEELSGEHDAALAASKVPVVHLPGRIRLRPGLLPTEIPAELERLLDTGRCCLVVHGGPAAEVAQLAGLARKQGRPVAITPWGERMEGLPSFEYYPAGNLMARAAHVFTGAGYNAMADMMFLSEAHTAVAFPRRFDDQAARLASWRQAVQDGTREAAQAIAAVLAA
ncbi:hypothetical protein [Paludibaculum fermentans]|uniref:Glycosyltransferase n=1 Tax=Paludibaculum fermentans TaxID=1473598 RepID=A0A7S7NQ50_PALFE|nr:hypothetical protein [Paludibaculum fermentans]QOY87688.1 hypothetical protein IRI77_33895 [Paludibaculum fermentans]